MKEIAKQAPSAPARTLKIEEAGDKFLGGLKPRIRLMGHWLRQAGFDPGSRVTVTHLARGVIQLSAADIEFDGCSQIPRPAGVRFAPVSGAFRALGAPYTKHLIREQGGRR